MLVKKDIARKLANEQVRAALGPRAYCSKAGLRGPGACLWPDNADRALCAEHAGPLLAAKGEDYRELVRLARARSLFENADLALREAASKGG